MQVCTTYLRLFHICKDPVFSLRCSFLHVSPYAAHFSMYMGKKPGRILSLVMPLNGIALFDYIMPGKCQCELTFKDRGSLKLIIILDTGLSDRPQWYWTKSGTFQYNKAGQIYMFY